MSVSRGIEDSADHRLRSWFETPPSFQILMELSSLPLANFEPSGAQATPRTAFSCPFSVRIACPVATSQTLIVLS